MLLAASQFLYLSVYALLQVVQPVLVPLCFLFAWSLTLLTFWSLWSAARDGISKVKTLHQIPCAGCQFFTGDYHLKCPVRPMIALSEEAINCSDYEPTTVPSIANRLSGIRIKV